jgi:hypothetical protein
MKLQRVQKTVFRVTGNFDRHTAVREIYMALKIPFVYNYIIKLYRKPAKVI